MRAVGLVASALVALVGAGTGMALAPRPPAVAIEAPATFTMGETTTVVGTAYDTRGRRVPSARLAWTVLDTAVLVLLADTGRTVPLAASEDADGIAGRLVATWLRTTAPKLVAETVLVRPTCDSVVVAQAVEKRRDTAVVTPFPDPFAVDSTAPIGSACVRHGAPIRLRSPL